MQDTVIQPVTQPFFKLIQANMDLLARFSPSSEAFSRSLTDGQRLLQQTQGSLTNFFHSKELAEMMQGMLNNYTDFMTEVGQNALAMMAWSQQATTRQIDEGTGKIINASEAIARRSHKAA